MYPVIPAKGAMIRHTQDILHEKIKPITMPVSTAHTASSIDPRPSVETPLII
jgi:hypothetical protein